MKNWKISLSVGAAGMALPFGLGCAVAYGLYHEFREEAGLVPISFGTYMLFVGVAMAITVSQDHLIGPSPVLTSLGFSRPVSNFDGAEASRIRGRLGRSLRGGWERCGRLDLAGSLCGPRQCWFGYSRALRSAHLRSLHSIPGLRSPPRLLTHSQEIRQHSEWSNSIHGGLDNTPLFIFGLLHRYHRCSSNFRRISCGLDLPP